MPPLGLAKGGHKFSKGGQCPPLGGAVKYPESSGTWQTGTVRLAVFHL